MIGGEPCDAELVRAARGGDDAAFAQLVRRYETLVFSLARRSLADASSAQDIVQETFVSAWRALDRYDTDRPLAAWLRTITLNKVRDRRRRSLVRRAIFAPFFSAEEVDTSHDPTPGAETQVGDRQRLERLQRGIERLPDHLRESLVLTTLEGLSQKEAALLLGTTAKTVETRVYRARRRLAAMLEVS